MSTSNTQRSRKHRAAKSLGLVRIPHSGYVTPETCEDIEREADAAEKSIAKEISRAKAKREKP